VAVVPNSAKNLYQVKELLQLGNIVINSGATAVAANGIHVNVYLGDVNADHNIDGLDKLAMDNIAQGRTNGFSQFSLLDPVIVGDVANDLQVDAGDVSTVDSYQALLAPPQIPVPPGLSGIASPLGADPILSLGEPGGVSPRVNTPATISILLDDPHPTGSSGLTSATIALTYDPAVLSVNPNDIALGSIPAEGTGWQISSVIDAVKGQIVIQMYSSTPIAAAQPGSLATIVFNLLPNAKQKSTTVGLADSVTPNGQYFSTVLADSLGAMILSPGADRVTIQTGVDPFPSVQAIAPTSKDSSLPLESSEAWPGLRYYETPDSKIISTNSENEPPDQSNDPPIAGSPVFMGNLPFLSSLAYETPRSQSASDLFFKMLANETDDSESADIYEPIKAKPMAVLDKAFTMLGDQDWGICD
jgi:Cohesin domain